MSLKEIYEKYASVDCYKGSDKGTTHQYLDVYERLFNPIQNDNMNVLEIGTCSGAWLEVMQQFFPNANIVGMDIDPNAAIYGKGLSRVDLFICDATNPQSLHFVEKQEFKIIIDDGSHVDIDIVKTFDLFYNKLSKDGTYIIEDIYASSYPHLIPQLIKSSEERGMIAEVVDLRHKTGRFDDVLLLIRWKNN